MNTTTTSGLHRPEVESYWREGFVLRRNLFSRSAAAAWGAECGRVWSAIEAGGEQDPRIQSRRHVQQGSVLDRLDPVIPFSESFRQLAHDPRLLSCATSLLGGDARLFKDKLVMKRPETSGYGIHQDYPYWARSGIDPEELLVAIVAIDGADRSNGGMELFPRLHEKRLPAPPEEPRDVDPSRVDLGRGQVFRTDPGDVCFMHSLVPHRSATNRSGRCRRTLFFTYTLAAHGDAYARYYADKDAIMSEAGASACGKK